VYEVSDCCLTPSQQFFIQIRAGTSHMSIRWWWYWLCTKRRRL